MIEFNVGDVRILCALENQLEMPFEYLIDGVSKDRLTPHLSWLVGTFLSENLDLRVAIQAILVESQGKRIVIDTCLGNDREIEGLPVFHTEFLSDLAQAGFDRELVDVVLCTHLHVDHVGWNTMLVDGEWVPTFPNATYLFGADEYAFWSENSNDNVDLTDTVEPIVEAGLHRLVSTDFAVTDEVRLRHTPGHTPGHVSVVIESGGQTALISGDIIHNPIQLIENSWAALPDHDRDLAAKTRRHVMAELTDSATLLIGTHFAAPTGGYVVTSESGELVLRDRPGGGR